MCFRESRVDNEDGRTYEVIERWKTMNNDPDAIAELESWREKCLKRECI